MLIERKNTKNEREQQNNDIYFFGYWNIYSNFANHKCNYKQFK